MPTALMRHKVATSSYLVNPCLRVIAFLRALLRVARTQALMLTCR